VAARCAKSGTETSQSHLSWEGWESSTHPFSHFICSLDSEETRWVPLNGLCFSCAFGSGVWCILCHIYSAVMFTCYGIEDWYSRNFQVNLFCLVKQDSMLHSSHVSMLYYSYWNWSLYLDSYGAKFSERSPRVMCCDSLQLWLSTEDGHWIHRNLDGW